MKIVWVNGDQDPKKKYEPDGSQEKPFKTYKEAVAATYDALLEYMENKNVH